MTISVMLDLETWGTKPGCDIRSIGACVFDPVAGTVGTTFYAACDNPKGYWGGRFGTLWTTRPHGGFKYRMDRDSNTVKWWSEQSDEAQAAFAPVKCTVCGGMGTVPNYADLSEDSGFTDCLTCDGRGQTGVDPVELPDAFWKFNAWFISLSNTGETMLSLQQNKSTKLNDIRIWAHGAAFDVPILTAAYEVCRTNVPWHYRGLRDTRTLFDAAGIDDHSAWLNAHPGPLGIPHHALDDAICQARAVCAAYARIRHDRHHP